VGSRGVRLSRWNLLGRPLGVAEGEDTLPGVSLCATLRQDAYIFVE